jgi:hypothetical protein
MNYTHNIKLLLLDDRYKIIEDIDLLNEIKNILCQNNTNICNWNGKLENVTIKWDKKELNELQKHFLGDLFSSPIYEMDSIILEHTEKTIAKINSGKYNIKFYISRLICDKKINKYTCGTV